LTGIKSFVLLGRNMNMNTSPLRVIYRVLLALVMLLLAQPSFAQQKAAPPLQQAPVSSQPSVVPAQAPAVVPVQAPTGRDRNASRRNPSRWWPI
jgi:hypothetical protein